MIRMPKALVCLKQFLLIAALWLAAVSAHAATGVTGGGQPFDNQQPSLTVTSTMPLEGIFPSNGSGGSATGDVLGFVYHFAGNFPPGSSQIAQGQLLSIANNNALYALIGTTYGGDGVSTFALPNLQGSATIGVGSGPGLSAATLGVAKGATTDTLSTSQIPSHAHSLPNAGLTGSSGGGQAFDNMQPSLPLKRLIAVSGIFPSQGGGSGSAAFLGQVATFAGNFVPSGWMATDGQLLSIATNQALFAILGTTYGGNGTTNFALPDLRGRVAVGADGSHPLGSVFGQETVTLTGSQLPAHSHSLPAGGVSGTTGSGQAITNNQPSLALNYIIATTGIFPARDSGAGFDNDDPVVGQIAEFAGNFAPSGWAFANGQLLPISQNTALFSILGTQYGGNGTTNFALPDLRGRTLLSSGSRSGVSYLPGGSFGTETTTLAVSNMPAHSHALSSNADLSNLTISAGALSPAFASASTAYSAQVLNAVTSLTVTPTVADSLATVKVNGSTVVSGGASGAIALAVGSSNIINIVVTAADGVTTKNYAIYLTRLGPPDLAIAVSTSGTFAKGSSGSAFSIIVSNLGGAPSDGTQITVTNTLSARVTAVALSGSGWNCTLGTLTCTRTDVLAPFANYPPITLTVSVDRNAASPPANTVGIAGGGDINAANNTVVKKVSGMVPTLYLLLN